MFQQIQGSYRDCENVLSHEFPSAIALETTSNDKEAPQTQRNKIKEFILCELQLEKPALLSKK